MKGDSHTYVLSRESAAGAGLMPLYEYLDVTVQDLGKEAISAHFGGWLGYDLGDDSFGSNKNTGNDLQYGYVSCRTKNNNGVVNLGRVMVFEGVAAERVDGLYARTDISEGIGLSVFGGAPVEITRVDLPGNNTIYGGRISHQNAELYTIGLSYLNEDKNSEIWRREGGIDLWIRPANKVAITGKSSFNFQTTGWMEHSYYLMLSPAEKLRVNAEATWINYEDYFISATSSVFKLTPGGPLDPKEKVNILGPEIFYAISEQWAVSADYKTYGYDIAGSAGYYGVKATFSRPRAYNAGISIHKMDGEADRLKYDEYRIYASKKVHKLDLGIDFFNVKYNEPVNNVTNAYSASLGAGYELTEKLKLGIDAEYSKNPDFDKEVRVFAKMLYHFDVAGGPRKSAEGQEKHSVPVPAAPAAAPDMGASMAAPESAAPAAVPAQAAAPAPAEQAASPGGAEQAKPKEVKE